MNTPIESPCHKGTDLNPVFEPGDFPTWLCPVCKEAALREDGKVLYFTCRASNCDREYMLDGEGTLVDRVEERKRADERKSKEDEHGVEKAQRRADEIAADRKREEGLAGDNNPAASPVVAEVERNKAERASAVGTTTDKPAQQPHVDEAAHVAPTRTPPTPPATPARPTTVPPTRK